MYQANVYKIMIGSPSDIKEEVQTAIDVLKHWNNLHSEQNKIVLLPLHWSFSSYPTMGRNPQKSLDKQMVEKSDLMVCIFGTRLGSPTDTEISGTVEEINEHRKIGKDVMVFFKKSADDVYSMDPKQLQKIVEFRESIKNDALWCDFSDENDFKQKLEDKLQLYINEHWAKTSNTPDETSKEVSFTESELAIIIQWANSSNSTCHWVKTKDGCFCFIGDSQYQFKEGREMAEFEDFLNRLQELSFIGLDKYNRQGEPVYKLTKAAHNFVDKFSNEKEQ